MGEEGGQIRAVHWSHTGRRKEEMNLTDRDGLVMELGWVEVAVEEPEKRVEGDGHGSFGGDLEEEAELAVVVPGLGYD